MNQKNTEHRPGVLICKKALARIRQSGPCVSYPKGQMVFTAGEVADRVFFIEEGMIKVFTATGEGHQMIVALRYAGELLGLAETLYGGERSCSAEAVAPTRLIILPKETFLQLMRDEPNFALRVSEVLGARVREAQIKLCELTCYQVPGRLALYLLNLMERCGVETPQGIKLDFKLTHEELARIVGTSRPTLTSTLNSFRKEGSIDLRGREIWIIKPEKLRHWIVG
ncbi:MAG: Crp/Fnr family transcriptional regulator [Thermoanaerobacterales bacterium]|nr:Crp/Fnr family transcriptional regulator [Bacillota bacterium]MDI6906579.1 Crp/Fnr family transcriptional regulator [Thermoanaerobacterales bacterium]